MFAVTSEWPSREFFTNDALYAASASAVARAAASAAARRRLKVRRGQ